MMAAQFLQREIRQYCSKPGADHYNSPVTPLIYTDPTEAQRLKPVNILWVPATLGHDTYNHIVPLLPWKCSCVSSELCLFGRGLNQEDKWRTQRKEMVLCSSCREWYHCVLTSAGGPFEFGLWLSPSASEFQACTQQRKVWRTMYPNLSSLFRCCHGIVETDKFIALLNWFGKSLNS